MTLSAWKTATAASEGTGRRRWPVALALAGALACSGAKSPEPPPQTVAPTPPSELAEPATPAAPEPRPPQRPPTQVIAIEPVAEEPESEPTLVEAAQLERERRRQTGAPIAVIDDKNLQEHATGQLTFAEEEVPATERTAGETEDGGDSTADEEAAADSRDETYWRERVRALRARWRAAADRVPELEERVSVLRRQFYEADDPYYRDTRIKPAWDRAIDQIAQARAEAESHRLELERVLAEGRRAGALPGWLREGIELEPPPEEPATDSHEPGEPEIHEIEDGRSR